MYFICVGCINGWCLDFKYDRKLQEARKALREDDMEAKKTGGTVDWDYLLSRVDSF